MPNWCMNNLTISHDDKAMVQKFADAYNSGEVCNSFIPKPENLNDDAFAADGWYVWCVNNWGTKWDFGKDEYEDPAMVIPVTTPTEDGIETRYEVGISFNTAWSPPIPFYDHLVELGYKVRAAYFEPGCCFCGNYYDGYDNYIDYGGQDINPEDVIPVAIWNEFGMDDFFEMMDEEA